VIRAAIGYALAEDAIGLARFREKYNPKMDGESDRAAFDLASKPAKANSADFARIAKMAASIDTLDGFRVTCASASPMRWLVRSFRLKSRPIRIRPAHCPRSLA
jgi:hypothetical protein